MEIRCAECQCIQQDCIMVDVGSCNICTRGVCCCASIHRRNSALKKKPLAMANIRMTSTAESDDCCSSGACKKNKDNVLQPNLTMPSLSSSSYSSSIPQFLRHVKALYAAALGIEFSVSLRRK